MSSFLLRYVPLPLIPTEDLIFLTMTMQQLIRNFPAQLHEAAELTVNQQEGNTITSQPQQVVLVGMGGSGIGAHLVKSLLDPVAGCPVEVLSDYRLPAYVGPKTLVLGSSFSGNTEETLSAIKVAHERHAAVVGATSGGELLELCQAHQWPHVVLPVKAESPRAHLGFSFVAMLKLLHEAGVATRDYTDAIHAAADFLEAEQNPIQERAAKVAAEMRGYIPLIYADQRLAPVATRLRQQINENGKQLAHAAALPEMNHNELVSWLDPTDLMQVTRMIYLESDFDHPRTLRRREVMFTMLPDGMRKYRVQAQGSDFLTQMLYLAHLSDWLSWHLANENSIDPFSVSIIERLKNRIKDA